MDFREKDEELQHRIITSLFMRQTINMNNEIGVAHLQAEWEDKINPTVTLTGNEIKKFTGREKLRDAVLDGYAHALAKPGIDVQRLDDSTLQVSLVPVRVKSNEFSSLADLIETNEVALKANPELGDPPY